jgi:hypothetical protein
LSITDSILCTFCTHLRWFWRHGHNNVQREPGHGPPGLVLCDAGECAIVLNGGRTEKELTLARVGRHVLFHVVILPKVDVVEERRAVVDVGVAVAPRHLRRWDGLKGTKTVFTVVGQSDQVHGKMIILNIQHRRSVSVLKFSFGSEGTILMIRLC